MRKLLVLLVAAAFVFTMALPAMAAGEKKVDLYGSVRVMTYIYDTDKENNGTNFDDSDLIWALDEGSSRFGARFSAGDIGANVEIRPRDKNTGASPSNGADSLLRQWNATWNFGQGTLLVGQAYTPSFHPICNECLVGGGGVLDGYGDNGVSVRGNGLQVWFPIKAVNGMLKIAALNPADDTAAIGVAGFGAAYASNIDQSLPQIEAGLSMAFGPLDVYLRGLYKTFDSVNTATNEDVSVDTWLLGIDATYSMGPFYAKGLFYTAQNLYEMSSAGAPPQNWVWAPEAFVGTSVEDVDHYGWFAVVGFKFNDKVAFEGGYGQKHTEQNRTASLIEYKDETSAIVFFLPITVAKGFTVTPEVLIADQGEQEIAGVKQGDRGKKTYYGLYWRIDF